MCLRCPCGVQHTYVLTKSEASEIVHACAGFVEAGRAVRHQRLRPPAGVRRGARKAEGVLDTSAPTVRVCVISRPRCMSV